MPSELALILTPGRTYAALARAAPMTPLAALRRPALVAFVIGTSLSLSSTGHVMPGLVVRTTVAWSVVVVLQIAIALAIMGQPGVGRARALDLYFASHAPWSLWMLGAAAWTCLPVWTDPVEYAALLPIALTPRIIAAFFREVCGMDRRAARRWTIVQQALSWGAFVALFGTAVAIWPRLIQTLT